jgi:hypothetical protein
MLTKACRHNPSPFQIFRFLHSANAPLAIGVPGPAWLARWVSWAVMIGMGVVVGEWVLGYKGSYEEYYIGEERKGK